MLALLLVMAAADPLAGCTQDPASWDLVLQCPDVVVSVEEEVGGDAQKMLETHLAGVSEELPDVEITRTKTGASFRHEGAAGLVDVVKSDGVTRVVGCGGPAAIVQKRCGELMKLVGERGSDVVPAFFRARDVEKSWGLDKSLGKGCTVRRGNLILDVDCGTYGFMVAKADRDENKRVHNLRTYLASALKTHELFDDDPCTVHGAPGRCVRADRDDVHVVVAEALVAGDPVQVRCDWQGAAALPALCALHLAMQSADAGPVSSLPSTKRITP